MTTRSDETQKPERRPRSVERWEPFSDIDWLERFRPFREFGLGPLVRGRGSIFGGEGAAPAVDISEDDGQFVVSAELPGVKSEDVHLEVHGDVLTLSGEKRSEREEKAEERHYVERRFGRFSRSFTMPANADLDRIRAKFADGVLTVEIPKSEESKPRVISIGS
ncbi:MAG: Hsp20/alpha crystallin family protein [Myxococcota bacterium]